MVIINVQHNPKQSSSHASKSTISNPTNVFIPQWRTFSGAGRLPFSVPRFNAGCLLIREPKLLQFEGEMSRNESGDCGSAQPGPSGKTDKPKQKRNTWEFEGENEDMWWRSDSSFDGQSLDDVQYDSDPLYDPNLDEKDQEWVDKLRGGHQSDAVLNCPCCFTTLCLDSQEHAKFAGQYRAMFVMNCRVDVAKRGAPNHCDIQFDDLKRKNDGSNEERDVKRRQVELEPGSVRKDGTRVEADGNVSGENKEAGASGHPVFCATCGAEVAVYDSDKVYHFFNVFPSNA